MVELAINPDSSKSLIERAIMAKTKNGRIFEASYFEKAEQAFLINDPVVDKGERDMSDCYATFDCN